MSYVRVLYVSLQGANLLKVQCWISNLNVIGRDELPTSFAERWKRPLEIDDISKGLL